MFGLSKHTQDRQKHTGQGQAEAELICQALDKSQAVISFELDGTIISANRNFLSTVGYDLDEIKGKHHRIFVESSYAHSEEYRRFWDLLRRGDFHAAEFRRVGKEGKEIWIQATYNPIVDAEGKLIKVVKFAADITDQVIARKEAERVGALIDQHLTSIQEAIEKTNAQASSASGASSETLRLVQSVASASHEFEVSNGAIAQSMTQSRTEVERAMAETRSADEATQRLAKVADAMSSIVELIQRIAEQINLLALNATIEAARAGESGRGFAVVAAEVKNLASQVGQATKQISNEISDVQSVSGDVVDRLRSIRSAVETVETSIVGVAGAVVQQSATSRKVASNIHTTATAVENVTASLDDIAKAVHQVTDRVVESTKLNRQLQHKVA